MNKITSILIMSLISMGVSAQNFNKEKMDSLLNKLEDKNKAMGSLSIFKEGEEVYARTIGYADVENSIKADGNTKYRIGSITKTFTAVMIMKMIEEGKLELSTRLSKFYPGMPNAEKITIKNLLNHNSGLFNFTHTEGYTDFMTEDKSKDEILDIIKKNGTVFEPGEKNEYSNTNYILLTYLLEDIKGNSYSELLREMIIEPLKLENTQYGGAIDVSQNEALSYTAGNSWMKSEETSMSIPLGAGGIVSTPHDLNKFFTDLFDGKLLTEASLDRMTDFKDVYGLGLFKFPFYDTWAYGHDGGIDGFSSNAAYFPEQNVAFSYTSNGAEVAVNDIILGILNIYFGKEYKIPEFPDVVYLPEDTLKKYVGVYSSDNFPVNLEVLIKNGKLEMGEVGKSGFPLSAYEENKFKYNAAGIEVEFNPEEDTMIFTQGGNTFHFKK